MQEAAAVLHTTAVVVAAARAAAATVEAQMAQAVRARPTEVAAGVVVLMSAPAPLAAPAS